MKNKVCLVHYTSEPGGIELLMPDIINSLQGMLFSVFVIRPSGTDKYNVYNGMTVSINRGSVNNMVAALRLFRYAAKNRDAIFHGFNTGPLFLLVIRLARIKKVVYSIRGTVYYNSTFQKAVRKVLWRIALAPDYRIIANSEYSRKVFLEFLAPWKPKVSVLYNPVNSSRLSFASKKSHEGTFNIIYVGRLVYGKNMDLWLKTAESIHRVKAGVRFYIYGDGPLKDTLVRQSVEKGMQDYLFFMGFITDIATAYRQADLMLFLSGHESFGNAPVESILCGTPVITCDIPSMKEIFRDFPIFMVSHGQSMEAEIIAKLNRLEELKRMVPEAAKQFRNRFSPEQHMSGLRLIYGSLHN
jgi:glycosyltransferase involved in cell wall biosynthesis